MMQAVDYVFTQMAAAYGAAWDKSLGVAPLSDIKSRWLYELEPFRHSKKRIVWALAHLPKFAPNAMEFHQLCRQAPAPELLALPEPAADPARVAAELARLAPLCRSRASNTPTDPKAWAHKIMKRSAEGEKVNIYPLRCARQALGLPEPEPVYRTRPGLNKAEHAPVAPPPPAQSMTPAEAYFAAEQAARGAV
jgi:hypothetical protein